MAQQEKIMSSAIAELQKFNTKLLEESCLKQYMRIKHHLYSSEWKYCHRYRDFMDNPDSLEFEQDLAGI